MNTRKIEFIDPGEDDLDKAVDWAIRVGMEECLVEFCRHIKLNLAFSGIEIDSIKSSRSIYYIEENERTQ